MEFIESLGYVLMVAGFVVIAMDLGTAHVWFEWRKLTFHIEYDYMKHLGLK